VELDPSRCGRQSLPRENAWVTKTSVWKNPENQMLEEEVQKEGFEYNWSLETFADGELQVGNDTMEDDLEALVVLEWNIK
jgi:hypothetical protein